MSLTLVLHCNGHFRGQPCLGTRTASFGYSPDDRPGDWGRYLTRTAVDMREGWRRLRDGGDLCPAEGHDETQQAAP